MAWVESHQEIGRHPKTKRAARLAGVSVPTMIGHLHLVWHWALDFAQDGDISGFDPWQLEDAALWDGAEGVLYGALQGAGFIDADGERRSLHDWNRGRHSQRERNAVRRAWDAMSNRTRPLIFARDGYRCLACGESHGNVENPLEVDHVIPVARGGENDFDNLQTLCRSCNRRKGAR
jgi:hypothetical protein